MRSSLLPALLSWQDVVLAAADSGANHGGSQDTVALLVWGVCVFGLISILCAAVYFGSRVLERRRRFSHPGLFRDLCRLHGLNRAARAALRRVVREYRIAMPAQVFTEPKWLGLAAQREKTTGRASGFAALRDRLFGDGE